MRAKRKRQRQKKKINGMKDDNEGKNRNVSILEKGQSSVSEDTTMNDVRYQPAAPVQLLFLYFDSCTFCNEAHSSYNSASLV